MKALIMVNRDFVLYNFRMELVERLISEKWDVHICLPYGEKIDELIRMGCRFTNINIDRRGVNPVTDVHLLANYIRIMRKINPDIVLLYTTKVCIYGGIAARALKIPYMENISGLGTAVEQKGALQKITVFLYKEAVKRARCIFFQNQENMDFFTQRGLVHGKYRLLPGSGVNLSRWRLMDYPDDSEHVVFLFIARVIREKGIEEYLAAAKQIRGEYPKSVFKVLGPCDGEYEEMLSEYEKAGIIEYCGEVSDTREYLRNAHCTIHPLYYPEGISNVLLESAACGRPVITTDRSGCRETAQDGVTGFIFEERSRKQLIDCVRRFMELDNGKRREMGLAGRAKMEREFDRELVTQAYMEELGEING
ncbi:MAG: glycosyltransferase family 4 protein [Lachnospiraceae bacterium]|nr:glycosyltransferase family 4 protein [Lachnospiraceae bacterium]